MVVKQNCEVSKKQNRQEKQDETNANYPFLFTRDWKRSLFPGNSYKKPTSKPGLVWRNFFVKILPTTLVLAE